MEETAPGPEKPDTPADSRGSAHSKKSNESIRSSQQQEQSLTKENSKDSSINDDPTKPHRTTLTLTLAIAYPKPTDEHSRLLEELVKKNKRTIENPKPIHFLHCDYSIAPENDVTATDVVTYAVAAKVFTDADSRVVKTWDDGRRMWVAWIHSHEIEISLENVGAIHNHVVEVKLYDYKEKISSKARGDRPKAFRLPSDTEFKFPGQGVHGVVSKLSNSWFSAQPRNSVTDALGDAFTPMSPLIDPAANTESEVAPPETPDKDKQSEKGRSSVLGKLAGINPSEEEKKRLNELKKQKSSMQKKLSRNASKPSQSSSGRKSKTPTGKEGDKKKKKKDRLGSGKMAPAGTCVTIKIRLEHLFAGTKTIAARLEDRSGSLVDGFVTIATDKTILPPRMELVLNPMCIKIRSAKDLPNTPIPQSQLATTSKPVFCQYNFMDLPVHTTQGRPHGKHIYFEDTHVIFMGLLHPGALREFILNNGFQIEFHDRDFLEDEDTGQGTIFGVEPSDEDLSNVALVSAKRTAYNAFKTVKKAFDPYGIAKVPLIDFLRGRTSITTEVVVAPCAFPEIISDTSSSKDGKDPRLVGVPGEVDRPERPPQSPGDYFEAGTTLKLKITLSTPLVPLSQAPRLLPIPKQMNPFARMVIYFDYKNKDLLSRLEHFVTMTNAKALGLDGLANRSVIDAALSTYKLTKEQKQSLTLDIITGFHLIDGNVHLMVLEGLHDEAMQRLLEEIDLAKKDNDELLVQLYDTSLTFKNRIYSALDVDLCRVRLHQSMAEIMSQPLIYIRDMIPRDCLECVSKLNQMLKQTKLRDVIFSDLFPTSEMVISMSREFGIPLTYEDFENVKAKTPDQIQPETVQTTEPQQVVVSETVESEPVISKRSRIAGLDNANMEYERLLRARRSLPVPSINHVSANIIAVQEAGKRRRPSHPSVRSLQIDVPAHNYSSQYLNTTEMAKNMLRDMLLETDPSGRYSYSTEFLSSMLTPVNIEAHYRKLDQEAKKSWKTPDGFVVPGHKTSCQDNQHPLKPVDSRIEDLKFSFRDNVLHKNVMEPILERNTYKWENRAKDLNLLSKPIPNFGSNPPYSIMLPGTLKQEEINRFKAGEKEEWRNRLIVEDPLMRFHRLLWETEDSNRANQLDRLAGVLKDTPYKYSLAKRPAPNIPLSVVMYPGVDRDARESGVKLPPAFDESREYHKGFAPGPYDSRRWVMEGNKIPIKDEEHLKFAAKHGHDMQLYHKEPRLLSQRIPVKPLTEKEYNTHLFRLPTPEPKDENDKPKTTEREEEIYGQGPRESSEYRTKFSSHEDVTRVREIYPRHTFHGFALLDKDGKPLYRDASIQLMTSDLEQLKGTAPTESGTRPEMGTIMKDEASVEIAKTAATPSVEVA